MDVQDSEIADPARLLAILADRGVSLRVEAGVLHYTAPAGVLTTELKAAVRDCRDELLDLLAVPDPDPASGAEPFPLTELQEAYLVGEQAFYDQHAPAIFYHEYAADHFDAERLDRALRVLCGTHDVLRLSVSLEGTQRFLSPDTVAGPVLAVADLSALQPDEAEAEARRLRGRYALDMPALDAGRPFLVRLVKLPTGARLQVALRLIAFDGITTQLFFGELVRCYEDPAYLPTAPGLSYRDYVLGLRARRGGPEHARAERYWAGRIPELPAGPGLPRSNSTCEQEPAVLRRLSTRLAPADWVTLRSHASAAGVPIGSALCALFAETLHRWSDCEPAVLTVLAAHRPPLHADVGVVWGNCSTTVLVAVDPAEHGLAEGAKVLQRRLYTDLAAMDVSGVDVGRRLQRHRGNNRAPAPVVFTSGLDLLGGAPGGFLLKLPGARLVHSAISTPQVLLDHQVYEEDGTLVCNFDFNEDAYPRGMLEQLSAQYETRLRELARDPEAWHADARPLLPEEQVAERRRANDTTKKLREGTLYGVFEEGSRLHPDRPAIIAPDRSVTYAELDAASSALAARLVEAGLSAGGLVAVFAPKGPDQVTGVLAVAAAAAAQNKPPAVPATPKIPHKDVPLPARAPAGKPPAAVPAAVLPPSSNADVAPWKNSAPARVGAMPITVAAATPGAATPAMKVHLADPAVARGAGVTGVLFSVELAQSGGGKTAPTTLGVDYSRFRDLTAGFGDRARLVQLPACVLTTPTVPACQTQTPIRSSVNDRKANVVSAQVDFSPTAGTTSTAARPEASSSTSSAMVVMATTTDSSGSNGTFTESSLSPSGTWSVTGDSGQFSWSYPVAVPPAASGTTAPKISLSYDSSSVDGRTSSTNNQVSWVGEGWDYSPGSIDRTYRPCADDTTLPANEQTGDQCWAGQIVTMNLGGSSVQLVRDDATGAWHPSSDNGSRVEVLTGSGNGALNGEYWKVTTTNGTQYFFGRNAGPGYTNQGTTNSTWTTPVYGPHPGDPCYNASGFAASSCSQAWRWNLDYVEDTHGNVTTYYYTPETNFYGADNGTTGVAYTRGGYLTRIDYGLRDENGSIYANSAPDQVQFSVAERCFPSGSITCDPSQFTAANAASWPDTPQDQQCLSGATCNNHAPSFWTTKRLTNITTQYYNGTGYTKVDSYDLAQQFASSGDPALWLNSITRTGYNPDGTSIALPPVSFAGQMMDNRVAGYNNQPPMSRWRLTNITAETGQRTNITYSPPECSSTNVPADPSQDTKRCFPVYWTFPYQTTPTLDYFHKYVVNSVQVQDPNALSPSQLTSYTYVGAPAWHFDDNEIVKPANRTYGQFRGYGEVDIATGDPGNSTNGHADTTTLTKTTYFRGMDGDTLPGGGTRAVTVTDSLGETVPDSDVYADTARESQTFNGSGGPRVSSTITDLSTLATTATRNRPGLPALTAVVFEPTKSRAIQDLAAGGTRTSTTTSVYDSLGRIVEKTESGDGVPDVCTSTSYAENTTSWIRDRVSEAITSQQVCPAPGTTPAPILADARTFYDGSSTLGTITGAGDTTRTDTATVNNGGTLIFATTSSGTFDASGRALTTVDGLNRTTTLAYTPADGGTLTQTVTTNPLNQTATMIVDPGRGTTTSTIDVAGHRTDATYDALGRLTAVWQPGHSKAANDPASATYAYQLSPTGPLAVTAQTLVRRPTTSSYVTSIKIYDAFGQVKQTQTDAEGGGRTVSDAFYDSHGWAANTHDRYYTDGAPSTTLISVADSAVNSRTVNTYDGTGRPIDAAAYNGLTFTWETKAVYGGDRTTMVPPAGGVTSTTLTDVRGKTTETRHYTAPPTINGSVVTGGTYQSTTQTYTPLGQIATITDTSGNTWTSTYDMLGNKIQAVDPGTGTSNYTYDIANQLSTSTDARGQTLAYTYDNLGRKTAEYSGSVTGTKLASWVYDTMQKGKLSYSTRYTPQGNYLVGYGGYDGQGNPTSLTVQLPASETGLNGNHTTQFEWNDAGVLGDMLPAAGGGLPGEWIGTTYDALGKPTGLSGYNGYVSSVAYTPYGEPAQVNMGDVGMASWLTYSYDPQTRHTTNVNYSAQTGTPQLDNTSYAYDPFGNPTRTVDVQGANDGPPQTQCFGYDALDRLSQAWTATDNCAGAPSTSVIGGVAPYWTSWTFDPTGLRQTQTQHAVPGGPTGDTTTTNTYPGSGSPQRSTLTSTATTGPGGNSSTSYTYDAAGNTMSRNVAGGNQTLTWDAENHLASDTTTGGTTSYVYDADGNQLVRHDPGSSTLYLTGEELTYTTATAAVTGVRYYTLGGQTVALRAGGANPTYLAADLHGSGMVAYRPDTGAVTRRNLDPYGNQLGTITTTVNGTTSPGTWPDGHGFLDQPVDGNTGLSDVGARSYDPSTGRFVSVDPLLALSDPQTYNGYAYGADNPLLKSDPTGLSWISDAWDAVTSITVDDAFNTAVS